MKNKIALATAAMVAGSSLATAEIVINDFLSFEGFVDMSYSHTDTDVDAADVTNNENSFQVDQVEVSWLFDFDPVTAQVDIEYEGSTRAAPVTVESDNFPGETATGSTGDFDSVIVEQAFATYHLDNGGAVTAGRYASMLGFEAFEPTGLYQYSFAYDIDVGLPGYAQGVKYTYESDTSFFGISLQDEAYDRGADQLGGNPDESTFAVEVAGSMMLDEGLSLFAGGVLENGENDDAYALNTYLSYETGAWIFAAELNYAEFEDSATDDLEILSGLLMANFAYSEAASVTGRVSFISAEQGADEEDWMKFTLAHGYAFTDNLFLVTEVSYSEFDEAEAEVLFGAVELLFTF